MSASSTPAPDTSIFNVDFNLSDSKNIFAVYIGGLFLLAYALSIFVSILHLRKESVVYSLTKPLPNVSFAEYIILIRTSQIIGSSFDYRGRIHVQINGSFSDSVKLHLKKGKGMEFFFGRGTTNIFVYHAPCVLGDVHSVEISMVNDAPNEIPYVDWRPEYISVFHSTSRAQWGSQINKKFRCYDTLTETIVCSPNTMDGHSIFSALCSFHVFLSLFNCPMRFGLYNNFTNVLIIFFILCGLMFTSLLMELAIKSKSFHGAVALLGSGSFYGFIFPVFSLWMTEIFLEALLRNTVPRVSACADSLFEGLVKPVQAVHGLRDFVVNFPWDKVSLIIPQTHVVVPKGSRHPGVLSIFAVEPVYSYYNIGGLLDFNMGRQGNRYLRDLSICALPLPQSMRWLAKEARSRKEDVLVQQYINNFTSPFCYFGCWLVDWPLHYIDEPDQIGLIFSHILCSDILTLSKLRNKDYCARFAQVCVHQWHGMISIVLLHIVRQSLEYRGLSLSGIRNFIHRTVTKYGKRNAREIQATWRKRLIRLEEMSLQKSQGTIFEQVEDENDSAAWTHSKNPVSTDRTAWYTIYRNNKAEQECSNMYGIQNDFASYNKMDLNDDDFLEDLLVFDVACPTKMYSKLPEAVEEIGAEMGDGSGMNITCQKTHPTVIPTFSIVQEDKGKNRPRGKLLRELGTNRRRPKLNSISKDETNDDRSTLANVSGDVNEVTLNSSEATAESIDLSDISYTDMNMSAVNSCHEQDKNENAQNVDAANVSSRAVQQKQQNVLVQQIVEKKQLQKAATDLDRASLPISSYEQVILGPPFDSSCAREKDLHKKFYYLRNTEEIVAHSCTENRCKANVDIHKLVAISSLEILKKILKDLLMFAMYSEHIVDRKKLWQRKIFVADLFKLMFQKAELFDSKRVKAIKESDNDGTTCNQMLTAVLTILEVLINVTVTVKREGQEKLAGERLQLYGSITNPGVRCIFCAKNLSAGVKTNNKGCYSMKRLVNIFVKGTVLVAEKEINIEFTYKHTVQRYCAMTVSYAMREVLLELEDPPLVMACKVTRAMVCKLLDTMLPKTTSFKDMTADELRRVGTRRERIQARHDPSMGGNKRETEAEKRKKQILTNLQEQLNNKWRIGVKENELQYCVELLAQVLVHEKIMGFSVYTGYLLKEHEELLDGNRIRLTEIERKAYKAVMKIARFTVHSKLHKALASSASLNVLFSNAEMEAGYILEAICVAQINSEPTFLKTCCFYIDNIINEKVEEFKSFFLYMKHFVPTTDLQVRLKYKMFKCKYTIDDKLQLQVAESHSVVASPVLRWGQEAVKGIPYPKEYQTESYSEDHFKEILPSIIEACVGDNNKHNVVSKLLKTRLKVKGFLELQKVKKNKELRVHLAQVQAHLTEQIALLSQSITNTYSVDDSSQREYNLDDLFNVELFATRNLKLPFPANMGTFLIILIFVATIGMTLFTTLKAGKMFVNDVEYWFIRFVYSFLMHILIFEPIKCIGYSFLRVYSG